MLQLGSTSLPECALREDCPVAPACAPKREAPCEGIADRHVAKLALCDALEQIADLLPGTMDRSECLRVAAGLLPQIRAAQAFEERILYPAFASGPLRMASLRRLQSDHVEDEVLAEELTEVLLTIGHGGHVDDPAALGVMLRTFSETMRQHIAFERAHVVPLVRSEATFGARR